MGRILHGGRIGHLFEDSRGTQGDTEALLSRPDRPPVALRAVCRPACPCRIQPAPPPTHARHLQIPLAGISKILMYRVVVVAPLFYVAVHVIKTPSVRLLRADRMRLIAIVPSKPSIVAKRSRALTKTVSRLTSSAASVFPLGLGG